MLILVKLLVSILFVACLFWAIIEAILNKPHFNVECVVVVHMQSAVMRNGHTTVVWYGGSCINKYTTLTGASIQVLVVQNIQLHLMTSTIGWYGQSCYKD